MKILTTQLLIFTLLVVSLQVPIFGQSQPVKAFETPSAADAEKEEFIKPNFKSIFEKKTAEYNERSLKFDLKKAEKEERKQQPKKKFWNKTNTAIVILFIVGTAALVFLVAKYGKDCIRTSPPDCALYSDENCYCEEYEKRVKD